MAQQHYKIKLYKRGKLVRFKQQRYIKIAKNQETKIEHTKYIIQRRGELRFWKDYEIRVNIKNGNRETPTLRRNI